MRLGDILKALVLGLVAFALDFLGRAMAVAAYGAFVDPGQTQDHYAGIAQEIALWSSRTVGTLLLFVFAIWFCRWGRCRSAVGFALFLFVGMVAGDAALQVALGREAMLWTEQHGITVGVKFAAAMLGGLFALWRRRVDRREAEGLI